MYINPNAEGVRRTADGGWDFSPRGNPSCIDDHFWSGLHKKLGLGTFRNADTQSRLFQAIAVAIDDKVRFSGVGPISIGPYGSGKQCVFYLVPSTFTHRSSGQLYDKYGISPDLALLKNIPVNQLTQTVSSNTPVRAVKEQAVARKKMDQRELPAGMTYDFYDLGGQWHGNRLYTPMLRTGTWIEAKAFCESLVFATSSGWSLPTPAQILSLAVDRGRRDVLPNHSRYFDASGDGNFFWTDKAGQPYGWFVAMPIKSSAEFTSGRSKAGNAAIGIVCTK